MDSNSERDFFNAKGVINPTNPNFVKNGNLNRTLIVITGPTASGKSSLAMRMAAELDCSIVSADSRQLYRGMDIGTAKPTAEDRAMIPHFMFDILDPGERYSAAKYEKDATKILEALFQKESEVIVCGGTGFYIRALLEGLDPIPSVPKDVFNELNKRLESEGLESLVEKLLEVDPGRAKEIDLQNPRRVIRSLGVWESTGKPFSAFKRDRPKELPWKVEKILLLPDRNALYTKIDKRVDEMLDAGLEEETRHLHENGLLGKIDTVGYSEWLDYFKGAIDQKTCVELIKRNTRRYAKRQYTWFRKLSGWRREFHGAQ